MGKDLLWPTSEGFKNFAEVCCTMKLIIMLMRYNDEAAINLMTKSLQIHSGQPRHHSDSSLSRFWKDKDRCSSWGDLSHCGKIEVDD